jgi:membrane protease YdiL (CAAX protease family)
MDKSEQLAAASGGSGGEPPDERTFEENAAFVRRAVIERLGPAVAVDEIVREVLARYQRSARRAHGDEADRAYLLALTANVCTEYTRSNSPKAGSMNGYHTTSRWLALGRAVLFMVGCAVLLAIASPIGAKFSGKWQEIVTGTLGSLGAFGLTILFVRWERLSRSDVGAAINTRSALRLAAGFALGVSLVALWAALLNVTSPVQWVRAPASGLPAMLLALAGYLALACREELAFRGYPLRLLDRRFGLWFAQIFVAVVFAAEHRLGGMTEMRAISGSAMGSLLFGMAALTTRGLAVPLGVHAAWNFGQWALGLRGGTALWRPVVSDGLQHRFDIAGSIIYLAIFGSATLALWLWRGRTIGVNKAEHSDRAKLR